MIERDNVIYIYILDTVRPSHHSRFGPSTWSSLIAAAADATLDVQWDSVTITADSPRGRMIAATPHGGAKSMVLRKAVVRCFKFGGPTIRMREFIVFDPREPN